MIRGLDGVNPVLVRELMQAVRGRTFIGLYMAWLAVQAGVAYIFIVTATGSGVAETAGSGPGQGFFAFLMGGLGVMSAVLLPLTTFGRVYREQREGTLPLLLLTRLQAGRAATGFLLLASVQILLLLAASFPFLVLAWALRGLEPLAVFLGLFTLFAIGLPANAAGLLAGSFCKTQRTAVVTRVLAVVLCSTVLPTMGLGLFIPIIVRGHGSVTSGGVWDWELVACLATASMALCLCCWAIALANLLFEAANRATLARAVFAASLLFLGVLINALFHGKTALNEMGLIYDNAGFFALLLFTFWAISGSGEISRRVREDVPRSRRLRGLALPLLPGRATALLFYALGLFTHGGLAVLALAFSRPVSDFTEYLNWLLARSYTLLPLGFAVWACHHFKVGRLGRVPCLLWAGLAAGVLIWGPYLIFGLEGGKTAFSFFHTTNITDSVWQTSLVWRGIAAPILGLLLARPALYSEWRDLTPAAAAGFHTANPGGTVSVAEQSHEPETNAL